MRLWKLFLAALAFVCLAGCQNSVPVETSAVRVTLDKMQIPAYEIGEKTAILLNDLERYGFTVAYHENEIRATAEMSFHSADAPEITANPEIHTSAVKDGVRAWVNGIRIPAYVFDGQTAVLLEDLCAFRTTYNQEWGYSDYNFRGTLGADSFELELFRLKLGDMPEIASRHQQMAEAPVIELYTEGSLSEAPYYGAKLEPKSGVYAGINGDGVVLDRMGCYLNYVVFDDFQTDLTFPNKDYVRQNDCLAVIAWNIGDLSLVFENEAYIRKTLEQLNSYNKPMIIRFGAEMNVSEIGDSPSGFVNAFRMVADMVHEYPNFATMWSVNDMGALNKPMEYYYPGDEYVDWIGISAFMKKHFMADPAEEHNIYFMTGDYAWHTNVVQNILDFMGRNGIEKPLAISEGGSVTQLHYNGGEVEKWSQARIGDMYWQTIMRYPQIKLIDYFNHPTPDEPQSYDISNRPDLIADIQQAVDSGAYRPGFNKEARFSFVEAAGREASEDIPLYTYVHTGGETVQKVSYWVDGREIGAQEKMPYQFSLQAGTWSDGQYRLTVRVETDKGIYNKDYLLNKKQGMIKIEQGAPVSVTCIGEN